MSEESPSPSPSLLDAVLALERPLHVLGVVASAVAAGLYIRRFYIMNFKILNEYSLVDYLDSSAALSERCPEEVLACCDGEKVISGLSAALALRHGNMIGLWSCDVSRCEALVRASLMSSGSRAICLDFRRIVWAENLRSWLRRMFQTSNPVKTFLAEVVALLRDGGAEETRDASDMTDGELEDLLVEFKILLAEKQYRIVEQQARMPDRPLVVFVKGIDRLVLTHMKYGQRGKRVLNEFLTYFIAFSDIPMVHVVLTMSDQFWLRYWLQHPRLSTRGHSVYVSAARIEAVQAAWRSYAQQSITHGTAESHCCSKAAVERCDRLLGEIVSTWGPAACDVARVLAALRTGLTSSVSALAKRDLRGYVMSWVRPADYSGEDSIEDSSNSGTFSSEDARALLRLFVANEDKGPGRVKVALDQIRNSPALLECALGSMLRGENSLLTLHMDDIEDTDGTGRPVSCPLLVHVQHLSTLGLYLTTRRPLQEVALEHLLTDV